MQRGTVTSYDKTAGKLRVVSAFGLTPEQMARGRYKVGEGIVERFFETRGADYRPNIGKEPLFLNRTDVRFDKNNISFPCVPIKLNEEILGVLSVDRIFDESLSFEEDLRVLGVVLVLIAQTINLYVTFEKERARREELEQKIKERHQFHNLVFRKQRTCPFEMFEGDVCKRVQDTQKPFQEALQDLEKERLLKALIECNFNRSKAVKKLGYTRRQLSNRIEKYNLKAEPLRRFS